MPAGRQDFSPSPAAIRPWARIAGLLLALAIATPGVLRLRVEADIADLLPQRSPATRGLALVLEGFGSSRTIFGLLELEEGSDPDRLVEVGTAVAAALRSSGLAEDAAASPTEGLQAADPRLVLDLADDEALDALERRLQPDAIRERAATLKRLLSSPLPAGIRGLLLDDPLGMTEVLGQHLARGSRRIGAGGDGFVSMDGGALLILIRPSGDGGLAYRKQALDGMRAVAAPLVPPDMTLRLTGTWAHATAIAAATQRDAMVLTAVAMAVVLLLYAVFYRSLTSLVLIVLLLPATDYIAAGLAGYIYGEVNPIAAGTMAILFGMGIDPAVHLIGRYREARVDRGPEESVAIAVRGVRGAVIWSAVASALSLLAVGAVAGGAMSQLGVLAGIGVLLNTALMLLVLPALLLLVGERMGGDPGVGAAFARRASAALYRSNGLVLAGVLLVASLMALSASRGLRFEVDLSAFQPPTLEPVQVDRALASRFGDESDPVLVLLRGSDEQRVLEADDSLAAALRPLLPESLASLRPADRTASARRDRAMLRLDLAGAAESLRAALAAEGFRGEAFERGLARLAQLDGPAEQPAWVRWFEDLHLSRLPGEVRVITRVPHGGDPEGVAARVAALAPSTDGVETWITGRTLVEREAAGALPMLLPLVAGGAGLALLLGLGARYRKPRLVLLGALPFGGAFFMFFALHSVLDQPITPFAVPALPLLIGLGVDSHMFVLDRYLEGKRPGRLDETLAGAGRAILLTTLTTFASFGVLALSAFSALASFGVAVAVAVSAAFLSSVVILPALIARWLPGEDAP